MLLDFAAFLKAKLTMASVWWCPWGAILMFMGESSVPVVICSKVSSLKERLQLSPDCQHFGAWHTLGPAWEVSVRQLGDCCPAPHTAHPTCPKVDHGHCVPDVWTQRPRDLMPLYLSKHLCVVGHRRPLPLV